MIATPPIHESFSTQPPPPWMRATVERLLGSLSSAHLAGLAAVVLTDSAAVGRVRMSCVLRVSGKHFDARAYAQRSLLPIASVHMRGEPRMPCTRPKGERHKSSGVTIDVSRAGFENLKRQIRDAIKFLAERRAVLRGLRRVVGVETMTLDFGVADRAAVAQFDYFPPELISAAGSLGIGLEISRYHAISG